MQNSYRADLCLSVVVYGGLQPATHRSLIELATALPKSGIKYYEAFQVNDALVARSRSVQAYRFLKEAVAPYMIFVDADIAFEPGHIIKLYEDMVNGYDLIGGVYTVKDETQLASCGINKSTELDGTIREMWYISTGFWGMSAKLLQKMVDELDMPLCHKGSWSECYPFFECGRFYDESVKEWTYLSEDWDFVEKARKVGVKPYLDTAIQVGHWTVTEKTVHNMLEKQKKKKLGIPKPNKGL